MKAGQINFLASQASYQHTVKINFKTPWWKKPGKIYEANLLKIILFSMIVLFSKELLTYLGHCLLSYTQ
jgi:hypothetical protein